VNDTEREIITPSKSKNYKKEKRQMAKQVPRAKRGAEKAK